MNTPITVPRHSAGFLSSSPKKLLIAGDWVAAGNGVFESRDPATGALLAEIGCASEVDVDQAVRSARETLTGRWAQCTPSARGKLLWRLADLIDEHADELAELETLDQGKTWATSRFAEIPSAAEQFRYYAGYANKISGTTITPSITYQPAGRKVMAHTVREPVGVVAAIVPWNSPLLMAAMKLAPALAAGCTVVLKPAEDTSLTAIRLGELILAAGIPAGTVNIVTGDGDVGRALAQHRGVDKVTFTGSTEVGKKLVETAGGRNLTRLTLELGGKSPVIVLDDADMSITVPGVARGIFANAGQVCVSGSRVYVARNAYQELIDGLAAAASSMRLGHGLDPASDLGPLVNRAHRARVAGYVDDGVAGGAEVISGGTVVDGEGSFYRPTVITGAGPDMALMREEIFGPVVAVTAFDDIDEVLGWANDTDYGLAASVWTRDFSAAHRLSSDVKAGTVWINCHSYFSPELPKGGHKQSGWGVENGAPGLDNYLESKTICMMV